MEKLNLDFVLLINYFFSYVLELYLIIYIDIVNLYRLEKDFLPK